MRSADRTAAARSILPNLHNVGVVIPTHNAEAHWPALSASLALQGIAPNQVLVVDSSSQDRTRSLAERDGFRVVSIAQKDFRHGATRQMASELFSDTELLVFMTQDAVLASADALEVLCRAMDDPAVGLAYGRQAPRSEANPIERHARLFNYPERSCIKSFECRSDLGIKAAFCSNSFAVYRRSTLQIIGGFPKDVLLAEDSIVAARMLMAGWKVAYCADAVAIHSHPLSLRQEFTRYFDTGAHHSRETWLQETFGDAGSEGRLFLLSELRYLAKHAPLLIPAAAVRTLNKFAGYRLGLLQQQLPLRLRTKLSGYPEFWRRQHFEEQPQASVTPIDGHTETFHRKALTLMDQHRSVSE